MSVFCPGFTYKVCNAKYLPLVLLKEPALRLAMGTSRKSEDALEPLGGPTSPWDEDVEADEILKGLERNAPIVPPSEDCCDVTDAIEGDGDSEGE